MCDGEVHIRHGFDTSPGRLVAMQKLAHAAGLAFLHSGAYLSLHASLGPWLSLRSVVVLPSPGPADQPAALSNPLTPGTEAVITHALSVAMGASPTPPASWEAALEAVGTGKPALPSEAPWAPWATMRRLCCVEVGEAAGPYTVRESWSAAEFPPAMLAYHYGKDTSALKQGTPGEGGGK